VGPYHRITVPIGEGSFIFLILQKNISEVRCREQISMAMFTVCIDLTNKMYFSNRILRDTSA
jgi:hypothetical protein